MERQQLPRRLAAREERTERARDVQRAAWDGSSYWLSVSDFQGIQQNAQGGTTVRRLTSDGHETGEPVILATAGAPIPAFATARDGVVLVINRGRATRFADVTAASDQIYAQRLGSESLHILSRGPALQTWPAVDSNAHATLIAWSEESGTDRHRQVRVLMHDRTLCPRGEAWFISPSDNYQDKPAIAASGDSFLMVWFEAANGTSPAVLKGAIVGALETEAAKVFDIAADVSFAAEKRVAVASDGLDYLTVWSDAVGRMWMRRISGGGALLSEPMVVNSPGPRGAWVALESNGGDYLLVWGLEVGLPCQYTCPGDAWVYEIWSMRIGRDGIPAPETRRRLSLPDRDGYAWGEYPSVTADGETFVVTWSWAGKVLAQRIDSGGTPSGNALPIADGYWSSIAQTPSGLRFAWVGWDSQNRDPILWADLDRVLFPGTASVVVEDSIGWPMPTVVPLRRGMIYAHDVVDDRGMVQQQIMMTTEPDPATRRRAVRRPGVSLTLRP